MYSRKELDTFSERCKSLPENTASSKLHLKLYLRVISQKDLEIHVLSHLVKEQRGQQTRQL